MNSSPGPTPRASIVIPVLDQPLYTRICLLSLREAGVEAEVIVVDNGSGPETRALLEEWSTAGDGRRLVRMEANVGFARGCNEGAARATGDVVVFLNNDTFVLGAWLPALLAAFDDADVEIAGSRLLYPDGTVQHAGLAFDPLGAHHVFVGLPGDCPPVLEPRDLQAVTGASLAIRRRTFDELGGFDVAFENSFEDVDLCLRVGAAGGRIRYVPASVAYHIESVSSGRVGPTDMRNYELFVERWQGKWTNDIETLRDEARAAGFDPEDRRPSRRELIDFVEHRQEFVAARLAMEMRSVRFVMALRAAVRRVIPRRR